MGRSARLSMAGLLILVIVLGCFFPAGTRVHADTPPRALLIMAFSPGESLRRNAEADLLSTCQVLSEYGFEIALLDTYNTQGAVAEYPHHQLRQHVENNRYNVVIYYGHGDAGRWAFCLPQDANWAQYPDTPQGRDESIRFGDNRGDWQQEIQLAPKAMIIMRHTCYSQGLEANDFINGAAVLGNSEILRRINEYSFTFLHPHTGIKEYVAAAGLGATPYLLHDLFANYNTPIGDLTVPNNSSSHQPGDGYQFLSGPHNYLGGEGMTYRKSRYPGTTNQAVWSQPAWAGDPRLTITDVCGRVPGDKNGDGDNTDLGEPNFPHDSRDSFDGEDTSYNFFPFLCIANPNPVGTWAEVAFYNEEGEYLTIYREVPAYCRITIDFNANRYLRNRNLAVKVRSVDDLPILAERPMYFRYRGWMDGGSDTFGSTASSTSWYFAEGYTSESLPFREYLCLGNFGTQTARGSMTLIGGDGKPVVMNIEVSPGARQTHYINSYIKGDVSIRVEMDQPIVAERSMYFRYYALNNEFIADGGNSKPGLNTLSSHWYFAEGHAGGVFEEWIAMANPNSEPTTATITYYTPAGRYGQKEVNLPPLTRKTVYVNEAFAAPEDVSVAVESGLPIACERAMYFNYKGVWDDGHVSPGNISPALVWQFAEGSAYPGIDEYILLMNTGSEKAKVNATYLLGPGEGTYPATYEIGPGQRLTINVNSEMASRGNPAQVALKLVSNQPIVAERAMYFFMGRGDSGGEPIRGGHVSLGVQNAAPEWYFAETYTGY